MKKLELSDDEYELIMKLRESYKKAMHKPKYNKFGTSLQRELERQERNMRKIASLRFNSNPQETYHNAVESSYHKKIKKTVTENGIVYEVTLEDIGDGNGLIEKKRKKLGKTNNINYRFSEMYNDSGIVGSKSYSKMVKTETKKGKKYEVTYEDVGEGNGMIEISRKLISNSNKKRKSNKTNNNGLSVFDTNNIERQFFKRRNDLRKRMKSNKKNNRGLREKRSSYKKKTIIESIDGEAYKVTYENVNNEGFREVNREKI
jgi:hypothetical protein